MQRSLHWGINTSMRNTLLALAALGFASSAHAQLSVTLTPSTLPGAQGSLIVFSGSLANTSLADLFINDVSFTIAPLLGVTLDSNTFFSNVPGILSPAGDPSGFDLYSGPLFGLQISPTALLGGYSGTVNFLGGADQTSLGSIGSASFQLTVTPAAPEPSTLAIFAMGALAIRRRRR
jgi:hypothetical protein